MPPAAAALDVRRLPFARLGRSFTDLFQTYCTDFSALEDFYAGSPWTKAARAATAQRVADAPHPDRAALADVLEAQNADLSADGTLSAKTRAHLDALRAPDGVAVVTGQQVGLFTGPIYTVYKTLTALQLAERIEAETGRPAAPVFWLHGEDHDFAEVATARLLRRNQLAEVGLPAPAYEGHNCGPVGSLTFEDELRAALDELDAVLPDSDFKPPLMEAARAAYAPGTPLLTGFARLLRALLPGGGLVFANPNDRRLKEQAAPLFRRAIETSTAASERVNTAGQRLEDQGFHAQVTARPPNLFLLDEDGRLPLDHTPEADAFTLRETERTFSEAELLDLVDTAPERFSPNVVLRPLMQDILLPTAAYVAGPSEVAYWGQLGDVYEHFGVEQPLVYPRASATLVEGKVDKVLRKFELDADAFDGNAEQLFQQVVQREMEVDLDGAFDAAQPPIHEALNELKPVVEAVDDTLGPSVEAARAAVAGALDDLKAKAVRAEKRGQDEVRAQLQKARANLFPGGALQERTVNVLYFLNKYGGSALLDDLRETLVLDTRAHQEISV